jgi:hypothetical protein
MTMSLRLASHLMLICFHAYCFVIRAAVGVMRTVALVTVAALYVGLYAGNAEWVDTKSQ